VKDGHVLSVRERLEDHRNREPCASCHSLMDPIGLSMENFDAVGAWRVRDGGTLGSPVDASGEFDGVKLDGVVTLRQLLMRRPELFVSALTEKLMIYALGRDLRLADDMPIVRSIVRESAVSNYRFGSIIMGIINSAPLRMQAP